MKVVIAMDSFKGSLSSMAAGRAAREGVLRACPNAEVIVRPLADGGEGTVDALVEGLNGQMVSVQVTGPLGAPVESRYGILADGVAVMEMASACGLTLVPPERRDPRLTTTYGLGEMILDALERGCRSFIIGIGGSATNDGGIGMLSALGVRFLTAAGACAGMDGKAAARVEKIDVSHADPRLAQCSFRIACDVENPLCGPSGASHVYGMQKGATPEIAAELDAGLAHFAAVVRKTLGKDMADQAGAGAAGGLGYGFASFLPAELVPGTALVLDAIHLEEDFAGADFAITGEGCLDFQTAMGKAPSGVARLARQCGVITLAFAGTVGQGAAAVHQSGVDAYFSILQAPSTRAEAMEPKRAYQNLAASVEQVFRLIAAERARQSSGSRTDRAGCLPNARP